MRNKTIEATVYLDRSAPRKVIVMPHSINVPRGTFDIVWRLARSEGLSLAEVKFKCRGVKQEPPSCSGDSCTMTFNNDYGEDAMPLEYVIKLKAANGMQYSSEPVTCMCENEDGCCHRGAPAMQMMSYSGPIIHPFPD